MLMMKVLLRAGRRWQKCKQHLQKGIIVNNKGALRVLAKRAINHAIINCYRTRVGKAFYPTTSTSTTKVTEKYSQWPIQRYLATNPGYCCQPQSFYFSDSPSQIPRRRFSSQPLYLGTHTSATHVSALTTKHRTPERPDAQTMNDATT